MKALQEFLAHTDLKAPLSGLETNPLPASLRVNFAIGTTEQQLDALAAQLRNESGVAEVVVERTWLTRINAAARLARSLGLVIGALFGLGAVLVTATTVRLAIEAQLDELKVMKLVGATNAQIRTPFLYFGAPSMAPAAGCSAAMLVSVGLLILESPLQALLGSFGQSLALSGFDLGFVLMLLGAGALLGVVGAMLAVRQRPQPSRCHLGRC